MAATNVTMNSHLDDLENEVTEVTALLRHNVEKVLARGEKIDRLQSRSEDLESSSSNFKLSAAKARKKMWWRNFRMSCMLGWIIFLIIAVIITIILVVTDVWGSSDKNRHNKTEYVMDSSRRKPFDVILLP